MKKLWLDMDGVIADFTAGVCRYFKIPFSNENYPFPLGLWDYVKYFEDEHDLSWADVKIACSCSSFWENLPLLPNAIKFYGTLAHHFDIQFLTTPTGDFGSVFDGKRKWLKQHGFAVLHDKRMTLLESGESKEDYAAKYLFLIDDQDVNVQKFRHGGGYAVLVPRPWNNRHREFISFEHANDLVLAELLEDLV